MSSIKLADATNPSSMGIKAIRQELESMGIGTESFIEKSEFVNALLDARQEKTVPIGHANVEIAGDIYLDECKHNIMTTTTCCAECGWPPASSQAWQLPSVGWPANCSSPPGVKMRTR